MKRLRYSLAWKAVASFLIALSVIGCLGSIFCMFVAYYADSERVKAEAFEDVFSDAAMQLFYRYDQGRVGLDWLDGESAYTGDAVSYVVKKLYPKGETSEAREEILYQSTDYTEKELPEDEPANASDLLEFTIGSSHLPGYMPESESLIGVFTYHGYWFYHEYTEGGDDFLYFIEGSLREDYSDGGMIKTVDRWVNFIFRIARFGLLITLLCLVVFAASLGYLLRTVGHRRKGAKEPEDAGASIRLRVTDRIPYGILLAGIAGTFAVIGALMVWLLEEAVTFIPDSVLILSLILCYGLLILLILLAVCSTAVRLKAHRFWYYTLCGLLVRLFRRFSPTVFSGIKRILRPAGRFVLRVWRFLTAPFRWILHQCRRLYLEARAHMPLAAKIVTGILLFDFVEALTLACVGSEYYYYSPGVTVFVLVCFEIVKTILLLIGGFQFVRLKAAGQRVAEGDFEHPIETQGLFWEFRQHGENINRVGDGIRIAVNERMKSERFRTELITNVSHDIKTPLTSIINYVDLMKKEKIDHPVVLEYMEVLDRQSARLKKLIEDLMEASKASTGSLNVVLENCDVSVMLAQTVGEFTEKAEKAGLTFVLSGTDEPLRIMADGRHLWRVFDNLLNNVCKYAMPGTRVYIEAELAAESALSDRKGKEFVPGAAEQIGGFGDRSASLNARSIRRDVVIRIKNISKLPLNITSEELLQRFVRGDESRSTEGSGLGLSIAQSLTELMDGRLQLEIDGDLFKVILRFPAV